MGYVTIHKDITNVEKTTPIGLTYVQTICLATGGILGFVVYFLASVPLGSGLSSLLMIVAAAPFVFLGMYKDKTGKNIFELIPYIYRLYTTSGERPYVSDNIYESIRKQAELEEKIDAIIQKDMAAQGGAAKRGARSTKGRRKNAKGKEAGEKPDGKKEC